MRGFIALALPPATRQALAAQQAALQHVLGASVRWTPPEQLHITVRFLGTCAPEQVQPLRALVERLAGATPAVTVTWRPLVGAFPDVQAPRILWAGLEEGTEALGALARAVEAGVLAVGVQPEERAFHPHVTLGRVRAPMQARRIGRQLAACRERLAAAPCRLERLQFMESVLQPAGPVHTVIVEALLSGGI